MKRYPRIYGKTSGGDLVDTHRPLLNSIRRGKIDFHALIMRVIAPIASSRSLSRPRRYSPAELRVIESSAGRIQNFDSVRHVRAFAKIR
jgi:hypothetical protein